MFAQPSFSDDGLATHEPSPNVERVDGHPYDTEFNVNDNEAAPSALPIFFGDGRVECFGFYHPARRPVRATGVVLCQPIGYEGTCAFETFTALAEQLAAQGFDVLRFDYHGTGDSPGTDADPDRVDAWRASIVAAATELRRLSGVRAISLIGLRLGASLAAEVASTSLSIDSAVLWAPCVSGRALTRELKVAAVTRSEADDAPLGDIEALGFLYTRGTLDALARIDLLKLETRPAPRILLIGRDARASEGPLGARLRGASDLTFLARDGFAQMLRDSHERQVPQQVLADVTDWLVRQHPVVPVHEVPRDGAQASDACAEFDGVRETPIRFGPSDGLFGIHTQPAEHARAPRSGGYTAILMLNVGTNHRVGPNRLYVRMARHWARAGYHTLRFDLAGMGDSRAAAGYATARLYSKDSVADVQAAIDALAARGCERFVLLGLCSGAYAAFQTTLADGRVVAQVLLNPRRLSVAKGDTLETVMSEAYKSSRYYQRALLTPRTYLRLLRGEVNTRGIGRRMQALFTARMARMRDRVLGRPASDEDVLANVRLLCRRGVESLFIAGAEDDGLDYLEFHLGAGGRGVRSPRFHLELVHNSDHTFSRGDSQEALIRYVTDQLERKLPVRPVVREAARWASAH
ncbi:MAG: alpha/beta fold hydrolase [Polyangiales bacterium]